MSLEYVPGEPLVLFAINELQSHAERYRLAWMSARGRAAAYADELDETRAEMAALRQAYREVLQVLRGDTP